MKSATVWAGILILCLLTILATPSQATFTVYDDGLAASQVDQRSMNASDTATDPRRRPW